jgi:hypothetical protein
MPGIKWKWQTPAWLVPSQDFNESPTVEHSQALPLQDVGNLALALPALIFPGDCNSRTHPPATVQLACSKRLLRQYRKLSQTETDRALVIGWKTNLGARFRAYKRDKFGLAY